MEYKKCSNPNCLNGERLQPITNFYKNRSKKDGYNRYCKKCCDAKKHEYNERYGRPKMPKEYHKKYYEEHKEHIRKLAKENLKQPASYQFYHEKLDKFEKVRRCPSDLNLLEVQCKYCGRWFIPTKFMVQKRLSVFKFTGVTLGTENNFYCSSACKYNCPTYRSITREKTQIQPATSREVQPELRKIVLERDNWTCQKCGQSKEKNLELELHCHHIDPVINNPVESADVDNCITLCKECHNWVHKNISKCSINFLSQCGKKNKNK